MSGRPRTAYQEFSAITHPVTAGFPRAAAAAEWVPGAGPRAVDRTPTFRRADTQHRDPFSGMPGTVIMVITCVGVPAMAVCWGVSLVH